MRKPGFVIALTAVLLTAILTAGQTAPVTAPAPDAAQDPPVFKSDVALVKVDAEVLDGEHPPPRRIPQGRLPHPRQWSAPVFKSEDILYFSQGEVPLDVVLLFDISSSMAPKLRKVAASAPAALAELKPRN
jgi:hypothetical protein